jgi:hypothetical protein
LEVCRAKIILAILIDYTVPGDEYNYFVIRFAAFQKIFRRENVDPPRFLVGEDELAGFTEAPRCTR